MMTFLAVMAAALLLDVSVQDDRLECTKVKLDKSAGENAFYRLNFSYKGTADGSWRVDMEDASGQPLSGIDGWIAATNGWCECSMLVPVAPDVAQMSPSFFSQGPLDVRDVRLSRVSLAEANEMVRGNYAKVQPLAAVATAKDWKLLPKSRAAIGSAKDFTIVFVGGRTLGDVWSGGVLAPLAAEYPTTVFRSYVSVCDDDGCECGCSAKGFELHIARYKPNLVILGDVPEADKALLETIARCRAIGAEAVVCAKPGFAPSDVQSWDISSASNRVQRAMMMFRYFSAARK